MVTYRSSSITQMVTVHPDEVDTILTADIPSDVLRGAPFIISGDLRRADTNVALPNQMIIVTSNGTSLGSTQTRADGVFELNVTMNTVGDFPVTVEFTGSTVGGFRFNGSRVQGPVGVTTPLDALVVPAILFGTAVAVLILALKK